MARLTNEQVTKLLYNSLTELDEKLKKDIKSRDSNTEELKYYSETISNKLQEFKKIELKIDTENIKTIKGEIEELKAELSRLKEEVKTTKNTIKDDLSHLNKLNLGRVPNYIIILLAFVFLACIAVLWTNI